MDVAVADLPAGAVAWTNPSCGPPASAVSDRGELGWRGGPRASARRQSVGAGFAEAAVKPGDLLDDFELRDQHGTGVTLVSLVEAGPLVLFFYPKAMTPG